MPSYVRLVTSLEGTLPSSNILNLIELLLKQNDIETEDSYNLLHALLLHNNCFFNGANTSTFRGYSTNGR